MIVSVLPRTFCRTCPTGTIHDLAWGMELRNRCGKGGTPLHSKNDRQKKLKSQRDAGVNVLFIYIYTYVICNIQPKSGKWDMPNLFSSPESEGHLPAASPHLASQHRRIHPQREAFAGQTCHLQGAKCWGLQVH